MRHCKYFAMPHLYKINGDLKFMMNKKIRGFTLLELMITLIIMAILATIALPSYRRYIVKSRLEEGKSVLTQNYLYLDRMYNKFNGYVKSKARDASGNLNGFIETGDLPYQQTGTGDNGYTFTLASDCSSTDGHTAAATFCLKGTPQSGQANAAGGGKECGTISVDQAGKYTSSVNSGFKCF